ncbi:hypothetical protein NKJ40_14570 [Mesorhizobium sp. M0119]|uniref:hypothetical protein n=1 Tax=Mesorhizobium sp. M0119 TaxID=2956885 RepID=UPI003337EEEA
MAEIDHASILFPNDALPSKPAQMPPAPSPTVSADEDEPKTRPKSGRIMVVRKMTIDLLGFDGPDLTSPTSELLTALRDLEDLPEADKGPLEQIRISYLREALRLTLSRVAVMTRDRLNER